MIMIMLILAFITVSFAAEMFELPASYDLRKEHPECRPRIRSQGECGGPLIFDAASVLGTSFCVIGKQPIELSANYPLYCCSQCGGCDGEDPQAVGAWFATNGTVKAGCYSYTGRMQCPTGNCVDKSKPVFYRGKLNPLTSVAAMQNAIYTYGSIVTYVDAIPFEIYDGGVLMCPSSAKQIDHAVVLIGWGEQNNVPYWLGYNSWGVDWGNDGYFLIRRGQNDCGIEKDDYAVVPA